MIVESMQNNRKSEVHNHAYNTFRKNKQPQIVDDEAFVTSGHTKAEETR